MKNYKEKYPVIPLINTVILPSAFIPIIVGRPKSISALEMAMDDGSDILCVSQKDSKITIDPKSSHLYRVGTICKVSQVFKMPEGDTRVLLEGSQKVIVKRYIPRKHYLEAETEILQYPQLKSLEIDASVRLLKDTFIEYLDYQKAIPQEQKISIEDIAEADEVLYFVLANSNLNYKKLQNIYEIDDLEKAIMAIIRALSGEIQIKEMQIKIDKKVKSSLNKMQREYYLSEQLKIINEELGKSGKGDGDIIEFEKLLKETPLNKEAKQKAEEEIKKLSRIAHHSQEYAVVHSYLRWIFDLPWQPPISNEIELEKSLKILDNDHYGLKKVKERIIEFLAVLKFAGKTRGHILCLIGPPGVGKTSLGKSIAKALDREFVRLSLGGVRDEAEIRGHRRTYVGAMPGIIMKSIKKAKTSNPVIMMDEIDKLSRDFKGDPASALLEVLDVEQNHDFRDHYLDFGYDLSSVMFIMTANTASTIPQPLLDRMEVLDLPGYTENEKESIATLHLIPKSLNKHKVIDQRLQIKFYKNSIKKIIQNYTRESGVRNLERNIDKIIRKAIKNYLQDTTKEKINIKKTNIKNYLGVEKYQYSEINTTDQVGVVTGLAWTPSGGETLQVEIVKIPGTGKLKLTGKLGEVMRESAQAALSYARVHSHKYDIDPEFHKNCDLHIHIPEGAIPKDGPSAGVTIITAIISVLSGKKVNHKVAMTGEISLTGKVLPIGGLPEKLIAAKRMGIKTIIIPKKNEPHLEEVNKEITSGLNLIFAESIEDVLKVALK